MSERQLMRMALELSKQDAAAPAAAAAAAAAAASAPADGAASSDGAEGPSSGEAEETSAESDDRASPTDELDEEGAFQTLPKPETDTERSLCEMGYPLQMVRQALRKTNGDLQRAAAICMSRPVTAPKAKARKKVVKKLDAAERQAQRELRRTERNDVICGLCFRAAKKGESALRCCDGPCMRSFHPDCVSDEEDDEEDDDKREGAAAAAGRSDTWLCEHCTAERHPCFHCDEVFTPDSRGRAYKEGNKVPTEPERRSWKCSVKTCGRYYHIGCVQGLKNSRIESEAKAKFVCPSHNCALEGCGKRVKDRDGSALFCHSCPNSFHNACAPIGCRPVAGTDSRMKCHTCHDTKPILAGDAVWCKHSKNDPTWFPCQICRPSEIPVNVMALSHTPTHVCVYFFGSDEYMWIARGVIKVCLFADNPDPPFKPPDPAIEFMEKYDPDEDEDEEAERKPNKWRDWVSSPTMILS